MSEGTIIYVGGFELPDKNAAAHRVIANGKIMQALGYEIIFVGVNKSKETGRTLLRYKQDFFGFECWSVPYPSGFVAWIKYILGLSKILDFIAIERERKVVSIVCYNYPAVAQLRIKYLCKKNKIKLISDTTEWYDASGGSLAYRLVKFIDTSLRMYLVNTMSDGIITTSKYITKFYADKKMLTLELPTLFDVDKFHPPPITNDSRRRKFVYVGMPFDVKRVNRKRTNLKERLDLSIVLFSKIYHAGGLFDFDIYGISVYEYLSVFPEHDKLLLEMHECVRFHGRQPNKIVLERIADCDFSIFFRDETRVTLAGFPSKLAESISCGTPVLTSKMVSIESYSGLPCLFMADNGDEMSMIEKVIGLSTQEVNSLKIKSFESRAFDYRNFMVPFRLFLNNIGV